MNIKLFYPSECIMQYVNCSASVSQNPPLHHMYTTALSFECAACIYAYWLVCIPIPCSSNTNRIQIQNKCKMLILYVSIDHPVLFNGDNFVNAVNIISIIYRKMDETISIHRRKTEKKEKRKDIYLVLIRYYYHY